MTKTIFALLTLGFASLACAAPPPARLAGVELVTVRAKASIDPLDRTVAFERSVVLSRDRSLPPESVARFFARQVVRAAANSVRTDVAPHACADAVATLAVGECNLRPCPDGSETAILPEIVGFFCVRP